MLVIYEAVEGMTKTAKGTIRLPYDHLSAYDAFEVLVPGLQRQVVSWNKKWAFSYLFFPIFVLFYVFPEFSSKLSSQLFKIETSNLV